MARAKLLHEAGFAEPLLYEVCLNHAHAGFAQARAVMLSRFVEFWCQMHAHGDWRVETTTRTLTVSFQTTTDAVLFQFSDEFTYFAPQSTQRPRYVPVLPAFMTAAP
jgi:hypothetical protein